MAARVIVFADAVRELRQRASRRLHARSVAILAESVVAARVELTEAPAGERWVRVARLRKLEELVSYASALG